MSANNRLRFKRFREKYSLAYLPRASVPKKKVLYCHHQDATSLVHHLHPELLDDERYLFFHLQVGTNIKVKIRSDSGKK